MNIDYDRIAARYDRHRGGGGPYLKRLVALAEVSRARRVLEIGPGTGNNTAAFCETYSCEVVGLEPSRGMLAHARSKGIPARWVRGSASAMPLASGSVDFVFSVYVLHHLTDLDVPFRECARVLKDGYAAFVTAPTDFIDRHPMNRYFPSFARIDRARFQPVEDVVNALVRAGFAQVETERFVDTPRPIDRAYADRVANKFISTYDLIPPDEFAAGIKRLYADIEARGRLDEPIVWESVVVWGSVLRGESRGA